MDSSAFAGEFNNTRTGITGNNYGVKGIVENTGTGQTWGGLFISGGNTTSSPVGGGDMAMSAQLPNGNTKGYARAGYFLNSGTATGWKIGVDIVLNGTQASGTSYGLKVDNGGTHTAAGTAYGAHIFVDATNTNNIGLYIDTSNGSSSNKGLVVNRGSTIFNEIGGDYDFRIEGDTDQNLFFSDASADRIGIGTLSPGGKLHVNDVGKRSKEWRVGKK